MNPNLGGYSPLNEISSIDAIKRPSVLKTHLRVYFGALALKPILVIGIAYAAIQSLSKFRNIEDSPQTYRYVFYLVFIFSWIGAFGIKHLDKKYFQSFYYYFFGQVLLFQGLFITKFVLKAEFTFVLTVLAFIVSYMLLHLIIASSLAKRSYFLKSLLVTIIWAIACIVSCLFIFQNVETNTSLIVAFSLVGLYGIIVSFYAGKQAEKVDISEYLPGNSLLSIIIVDSTLAIILGVLYYIFLFVLTFIYGRFSISL